jgi:signal transduction histidine kinase
VLRSARLASGGPVTFELNPDYTFTEEDLRQMVLRLAHEIRNPLATIKSAVQLIEHFQPPPPDVREYFGGIHTEIERIDRVVRDMQRYVRLDFHTAIAVSVSEVIAAAVESVDATMKATGSTVEVVPGPNTTVLADCAQLEAAVGELIDNALRFGPPGSVVTVRWLSRADRLFTIEVEDEGPGIAPEAAERILRPFFSTSTQGTGLGLNIAARAARLAGGDLSWTDRPEGGCRFILTLPRL